MKKFTEQKHNALDFPKGSKWSSQHGRLTCDELNNHMKLLSEDEATVPPNFKIWKWLKGQRMCMIDMYAFPIRASPIRPTHASTLHAYTRFDK